MIEEDEGSYYLDFFAHNLGLVIFAAFVMAPVIPGHIAQWLLIVSALLGGAFSISFFAVRSRLLKLQAPSERSSTVIAITSNEAYAMFKVVGSSSLMLIFLLAWMGFAGMLWILESFFVLAVTFHILNMFGCCLMELAYTKREVDEIKATLARPPETDSPE